MQISSAPGFFGLATRIRRKPPGNLRVGRIAEFGATVFQANTIEGSPAGDGQQPGQWGRSSFWGEKCIGAHPQFQKSI
ncbi:MAG: hypothetical protein U5M23_06405 [Marinagarivorans sp.]|nr:hypothetical protein [Marinagarivorans sp.]